MTHRERHIPDEAPARDAAWPPPAGPASSAALSTAVQPSVGDGSLWTDWFLRASSAQQQDALVRSLQQGVLYAHQLAAPARASAPNRSLLFGLLNGQVKELEPLDPPALEYHDGALAPKQREAVARAVATPDVCLIHDVPGTSQSRLLAEIILQAAHGGERVLFVAPTPAALDRVLEQLSRHPAVCPIRCLAAEEKPSQLPQTIARLTLPERLRTYRETTLPAAHAARDAARQALDAHLRGQPHWARLETLAEQHEQLAERLRSLTERRDGVVEEVERLESSAAFAARWRACRMAQKEALENVDGQLAGLQAELDTIADKQARLESEWESIRPLAEARQGGWLWTAAWWRALLRNGLSEQVRDLESRRAELVAARQRLEQDLAARRKERVEIENRYETESRHLRDEESARRHGELESEIAAVGREQDGLREQWRSLVARSASDGPPADTASQDISRPALAEMHAAWERQREQAAQRAEAAEQWLRTVEEGLQTLPQKLAGCANVIAATTTALAGEVNSSAPPVFDVLILEGAHQVAEAEFAAAARRARRWILLGEAQIGAEIASRPRKPSRTAALSFFQRLWDNLHTDPYGLPFAWVGRDGRLLCRLRHLASDQEKWIETEPVVDRPDIELRILSAPRLAPQVVEVVFPAGMGIAEAKQFIFHEMEELAVQTRGRCLSWSETAEEVILEFAPSGEAEMVTVVLESGVREHVVRVMGNMRATDGMDWHTCLLAFDRAAGWTRQRAEEWIIERLGLRCTGRTILLAEPPPLPPPTRSTPFVPDGKESDHHGKHGKRGKKAKEDVKRG